MSCSRPLTLFLMPQKTVCLETSFALCETILCIFTDKVTSTRALISPSTHDPSISVSCSTVFEPDCGPHVLHMMEGPTGLCLVRSFFLTWFHAQESWHSFQLSCLVTIKCCRGDPGWLLTFKTLVVIHNFVTTRLDYCVVLHVGQNAPGRFLTGTH